LKIGGKIGIPDCRGGPRVLPQVINLLNSKPGRAQDPPLREINIEIGSEFGIPDCRGGPRVLP